MTVLDLNNTFRTTDDVADRVGALRPDYVGLSVKSATFANAIELHKILAARYPEITVVYGGPHVTLSSPAILDEVPEAVFIRGDAEYTFRDFVTRHARGERELADIPGLMYRDRAGVHHSEPRNHTTDDLDHLPLPDFSTFDSFDALKTYPLLTSRGCPYKCTYCSVPAISGQFWVYRSPDSIMRELDYVLNTLKLRSVVIVDDNFTLHKRRTEAVCQAIIDRGYDFVWSCGNGIRADRIWPDTAELMYRAGCREVAFGIESWDRDVFAQLTKGEELEHVRHGIDVVRGAGIRVTGFFMIGLPGSTFRKDLRTLALARKQLKLDNYFFGLTVPYPGTELWDWAQQEARFLVPWQNSYHISEVFREGLERVKVEPVFDTPDYPAAQRKRMFQLAQRAKARGDARRLRSVERQLLADPDRPVVVIRSSRRDAVLRLASTLSQGNRHVLLWKGTGRFLETLDPELRGVYETTEVTGDGFFDARDAEQPGLSALAGAVVLFDVPGGSLDTYHNLLEFARALRPRRLIALVGPDVTMLPVVETKADAEPAAA